MKFKDVSITDLQAEGIRVVDGDGNPILLVGHNGKLHVSSITDKGKEVVHDFVVDDEGRFRTECQFCGGHGQIVVKDGRGIALKDWAEKNGKLVIDGEEEEDTSTAAPTTSSTPVPEEVQKFLDEGEAIVGTPAPQWVVDHSVKMYNDDVDEFRRWSQAILQMFRDRKELLQKMNSGELPDFIKKLIEMLAQKGIGVPGGGGGGNGDGIQVRVVNLGGDGDLGALKNALAEASAAAHQEINGG